ncbi:transcriptional regulator, IclR family [Cognatiyoonia koreensis]|uniref:Transcriptional regulator, IclR family n=1 Tax=Cognatiyoonia koreensis TaxID=364200 RepID=A0A1I0MTN7_9RHOB|nr:HTH-type transcriptional regulator BhcR [Cognatiyoonia koreensis]SEV91300.1 transcriptional regulator, IclR family [Cognatiyoonia koreensis]
MSDSPDQNTRARGRPRGWTDNTEQNTIKSLDRAMVVLERLSELESATLSQLASDLGQAPASIYRVLVTLQGRGIVGYETDGQIWHVGPTAYLIGSRFLRRTSLVERARPVLRRLMEQTGETANLGIRREGYVLFVSQVETHATIRAFFPPGTMSPMHASGIGKALLAYMPQDQRDRLLDGTELTQFTQFTCANRSDLESDLTHIRARGYSIDAEEKNLGMRCIAVPIFDVFGEAVAGISVSGPTSRVRVELTEDLATHVKSAGAELTHALGGTLP